jgi:hypothetical protein
MGKHTALYTGVPLYMRDPKRKREVKVLGTDMPDFVGFYRWHLPDPIVFHDTLTVTIQQIGGVITRDKALLQKLTPAGGTGFDDAGPPFEGYKVGIAERVDDYCAAAFLYCRDPQAVPAVNVRDALQDIGFRPYERIPQ